MNDGWQWGFRGLGCPTNGDRPKDRQIWNSSMIQVAIRHSAFSKYTWKLPLGSVALNSGECLHFGQWKWKLKKHHNINEPPWRRRRWYRWHWRGTEAAVATSAAERDHNRNSNKVGGGYHICHNRESSSMMTTVLLLLTAVAVSQQPWSKNELHHVHSQLSSSNCVFYY